jgi:hypothetical protein
MKVDMQSILWKSGLLLMAGTIVLACAEERDPISRVQPYALKKEYFIGPDFSDTRDDPEFYGRTTVTDVGYGASHELLFPSTIGQNLFRLKWQVTEKHLIARASYERIMDSDGKGAPKKDQFGNAIGSETHDGQIAAMFRIQSHFDIANDYNPITGEKLNVVGENTYDRPWYEREFMRVDWSANLATDSYDFDPLAFISLFGTTYEPIHYYVEDPNDPDAPVFDLENGYLDVTTKAFARPGMIDLSHMGWGIKEYPACFLPLDIFGGSAPMGNCNPVEITLRHSFRKIVDTDYEPMKHDGGRHTSFGGFLSERFGYNRAYGMTDTLHHRLLNRYNIWERSHYYDDPETMSGAIECFTPHTTPFGADPNRDEDNNGTADECEEAGKGSRCDSYKQKCTLPYTKRTPKPLAWYYTEGSDPRYFEASAQGANEWDVALRVAVQAAKYAECNRVKDADCATKYPVYHGQIDDGWDAISLSREVDACRRTVEGVADPSTCNHIAESVGQARGYDAAVIAIAKMPEMIVLCHSPVQALDPEICGKRRLPFITVDGVQVEATGEDCTYVQNLSEKSLTKEEAALLEDCENAASARIGDLRYDTINVFHQAQTGSPWGIMVSAVDPTTGETVSTSANVWSWVNDFWSQMVVDQVRIIKGAMKIEDFVDAKWVSDYARSTEAATRGGVAGTMNKEFVEARVSEFASGQAKLTDAAQLGMQLQTNKVALKNELKTLHHQFMGIKADAERMNANSPIYAARSAALANTEIEAELMSGPIRQLYGTQNVPLSDSMMDLASPLRGANFDVQRELKRMVQNALHKRGMCIIESNMSDTPLSLASIADVLEEKFGGVKTWDDAKITQVQDYIARYIHYSVITHEMGHSVSHRHNFVSSSDAWNFRPQYWQLRTKDGKVKDVCTNLSATGEDCVGPRYFDPVTEAEDKGLIWMWQNSSTMEYPGETAQNFLGIGAWDFAATRLFYGDVTDVFMDDSYAKGTGRFNGVMSKLNSGFGGLLGFSYDGADGTTIHYSQLNSHYDLIQDCQPVKDINAFKPTTWDEQRDGKWHPLFDSLLVSPEGDGKYTRCKQRKVDYVQWTSLKPYDLAKDPLFSPGMKKEYLRFALTHKDFWGESEWGAYDSKDRPLVGYGFATDRWADIGNAAVYRHDNGADTFEIFNFMMTQREMNHVWDAYRRNRAAFSVRSYMGRILGRYNEKMRDGSKGLALYKNMTEDFALRRGENPDLTWQMLIAGPNGFGQSMREPVLAAGMVFDHITRELTRPQSGPHDYTYVPIKHQELKSGKWVDSEVLWAADPEATMHSTSDMGLSGSTGNSEWNSANLIVPDGPFVPENSKYKLFGTFSPGGALIENKLADGQGDFDAEYTMTAGSYYNKFTVGYLMSESADNFISDSLMDFTDPRYRAAALAHLFPDGYRRLLGNMLTNDTFLKGPRLACNEKGIPEKGKPGWTEGDEPQQTGRVITKPLGWVSWWGETPRVCFAGGPSPLCDGLYNLGNVDLSDSYPNTKALDPQVGWEQQKWLIVDTLRYLRDNEKYEWFDMMALYNLSSMEANFENRIEFHDPNSGVYAARTYGKENIFGRTVQKGIAARVLEYANSFIKDAYVTTAVDHDGDGNPDWYVPVMGTDGRAQIKHDPSVKRDDILGGNPVVPSEWGTCSPTDNSGCRCEDNRACLELKKYISVVRMLYKSWTLLYNRGIKGVYN